MNLPENGQSGVFSTGHVSNQMRGVDLGALTPEQVVSRIWPDWDVVVEDERRGQTLFVLTGADGVAVLLVRTSNRAQIDAKTTTVTDWESTSAEMRRLAVSTAVGSYLVAADTSADVLTQIAADARASGGVAAARRGRARLHLGERMLAASGFPDEKQVRALVALGGCGAIKDLLDGSQVVAQ